MLHVGRTRRGLSGQRWLRGRCGTRLAQAAQHVAHHLRAVLRLSQRFFHAQLVVARQLDVLVLLDHLDDGHRVDRRVGLEGDVNYARRCIDFLHAIGLRQHPQAVHVNQRLCLRW